MARVETPIKSCNVCWRNYTISEWDQLELKEERGSIEERECAQCSTVLLLDRHGLDELDLTDDADDYANHHPEAVRPAVSAAPAKAAAIAPLTKPATKPSPHTPKPADVVKTWFHRTAPQIQHSVKLWIAHLPTDADAFTIGELRALFRSGWR